ncbi:shufflon system plasmid conjugative transfer pilus tip adhesin PilV [Paraburkholderia domus]|uniref:shufflon system plasmid conjugative transfer pilus tip adhesin PilV n=1 Tax=Paraburkholderia domus TaxID=2793075 RepID=UPI001912B0DB|nr:shufflon system plasmid conjugative transfer pilus tip adhesin PilV [Paraburkholderia domus]MBK5064808.1 shufflon system plasmid conjugative transfer pilus tip adhesin PilV [Burkholderia sp. R-70199]CAE6956644.1 hypothetical protein R70199_07005 [Paraburkholderia domus]
MDPIIGALAALVISMFGVVGFTQFAKMGVTNIQTAATASQQHTFDAATLQYVQDNAVTLAQGATAAVPVTITAAQLATAGYLPAGYLGTNSFGQTWQAQVLQPTAGQLETLVTSTGGNPIRDTKQLAQIAAETGAAGGFVPYANQAGNTFNTNTAYGTYGAWSVPLTAFSNPGSGHLASLLQFTNVQANTAYLYRVPVVNHPELNNMQTDLGLTDTGGTAHNITGVNTATASTFSVNGGGQLQADQGGSLELGGNNSKAGTGTPYIDFHQAGQGVQDFNVRIVNDKNDHLSIQAANGQGALQVQGTLQAGNVAVPGSSCSSNGIMGANSDGSGQILSCQYGTWEPIGGRWLQMYKYVVANGWGIPIPTCPAGGTAGVILSPTNFTVDATSVVNYGANPSGSQWIIYITDGSGAGINGALASAATYCTY